MVRGSRIAYAVTAWAFVVGLLAQVFFIGLGLFSSPTGTAIHRDFGWILHMFPLLIVLFAALSRAGRRHWQWALLLAGVVFLVPIFVVLRSSMPALAALHPVSAMLSFAISIVVALNATRAVRLPSEPEPRGAVPSRP